MKEDSDSLRRVKKFRETIFVRKDHLDDNDHVNNVQYLQWVQEIAKAHWEFEAKDEWLNKYVWVALSHHIEYKKPAYIDQELIVETFINSFDGVKSNRKVEIKNAGDQELICQCLTVWVMLDKHTNRPTRCPREMIDAFYQINE